MNFAKIVGAGTFAGGALTNQDWIALLGIIIMILSMLQDYLKERSS